MANKRTSITFLSSILAKKQKESPNPNISSIDGNINTNNFDSFEDDNFIESGINNVNEENGNEENVNEENCDNSSEDNYYDEYKPGEHENEEINVSNYIPNDDSSDVNISNIAPEGRGRINLSALLRQNRVPVENCYEDLLIGFYFLNEHMFVF